MSNPKTQLARSPDHDDIVINEMELRMPRQAIKISTAYLSILINCRLRKEDG
jgi:soluble lytic murein transglycosylase-like protein